MPGAEFMSRLHALDPDLEGRLREAREGLDRALGRDDGPAIREWGDRYERRLHDALDLIQKKGANYLGG